MPQVYQEPLCRRHFASVVSEAWCFRAFVFLATIILSLVIAYNTGGFWLKTSTSIEQPTVHYTWDAVLLLEGSQAGQEQIWSSNPGIAVAFSSQSIAANIEVTEEDYNFDGKPDQIRFRATAQSLQQVYSAKLLLQFSYQLQSAARLRMYSLAYVSYSSAVPGAALVTDGQLELQQGAPLPEASYHGVYNSPILNSTSSMTAAVPVAATLQLSEILKVYLDRNITTRYTNDYPVWQAGSSANSEFVLDVRVRVPSNQVVLCRPSMAQMLKVGWIQFLCIFFILWWGLSWFERQVFRYRILETRVVSDIQPKQLRF